MSKRDSLQKIVNVGTALAGAYFAGITIAGAIKRKREQQSTKTDKNNYERINPEDMVVAIKEDKIVDAVKGVGRTKELVLFDNYVSYEYFDEYKQMLIEANDLDDISDQEVWDCMSEQEAEDWDIAKDDIVRACEDRYGDRPVVVKGTAGTWRGSREAMNKFDDVCSAIQRITKDCDYVKFWVDGRGHLFIRASHHDGTHEFEIKVLTDDGERYYDNWIYGNDPRTERKTDWEILSAIWNSSKYSKLPNFD